MDLLQFKQLNIPDSPGVYSFKQGKDTLYIGKATSLRERLRSYFNDDLIATRGRLLVDMITKSTAIEFETADSVLEAFIRETELIKKYQPIYNTKDKDNKSFNYVVITDEDFPRVLTMRGRNLEQESQRSDELKCKYIFGPYPFGNELREALKIVRRIFPYRDTCIPAEQLREGLRGELRGEADTEGSDSPGYVLINKPCFNRTIGLCPGVCSGEISKADYGKIIQHIRLFFSGKKSKVLDELRREMMTYAKKQEFEKANNVKRTIFALEHIKDVSMIKRDKDILQKKESFESGISKFSGAPEALEAASILSDISLSKKKKSRKDIIGLRYITQDWQGQEAKKRIRIESYDIAHLSGSNMVGVMVVSTDGEFDKSQYRKFNIKDIDASNDTGALTQIISRRFAHREWKWPDMIVVDGGQAQLNAVIEEVRKQYVSLTEEYPELVTLAMPLVISVVKNDSHKAREILNFPTEFLGVPTGAHMTELQIIQLNEETHRFAITFHKKKRSDDFLPSDAKKILKNAKAKKRNKKENKW